MKIFLFSFKMAIKTAGSAHKIMVGRVSGNTAIFRLYLSKNVFSLLLYEIKQICLIPNVLDLICTFEPKF